MPDTTNTKDSIPLQNNFFRDSLDIYGKFNVNQIRDESYNIAVGGRWYIFMLRPCCNINSLIKTNRFAYYLDNVVGQDTEIGSNGASNGLNKLGKYLLSMLYDLPEEIAEKDSKAGNTSNFENHFIPLITNLAKGFEPTENQLEVLQVNDTFNGYKHAFVKHDINSVGANTFSIPYGDLEGYPLTNLHFAWYEYMKRVREGSTSMSSIALKKRIIDYPTSLYYFQLAPDGYSLNYWCKYTGVFPINVPFNVYRGGQDFTPAEIQITYQYVKKDDMDPIVLKEFNDAVNGIFPEMDQGILKKIFTNLTRFFSSPSKPEELEVASLQEVIDQAESKIYNKLYSSGKYTISEINDPTNWERFKEDFPNEFEQLEKAKLMKVAAQQNVIDKRASAEVDEYVSDWFGSIKNYPGNLKDYNSGFGETTDGFFQSSKPQVYKIKDGSGNSKLALLFD